MDGEYRVDSGIFSSLKFGVRTTEHKRDSDAALGQGPGCKKANGMRAACVGRRLLGAQSDLFAQNDLLNSTGTGLYPSNYGSVVWEVLSQPESGARQNNWLLFNKYSIVTMME